MEILKVLNLTKMYGKGESKEKCYTIFEIKYFK